LSRGVAARANRGEIFGCVRLASRGKPAAPPRPLAHVHSRQTRSTRRLAVIGVLDERGRKRATVREVKVQRFGGRSLLERDRDMFSVSAITRLNPSPRTLRGSFRALFDTCHSVSVYAVAENVNPGPARRPREAKKVSTTDRQTAR